MIMPAIARGFVAPGLRDKYEITPDGMRLSATKFIRRLDRVAAERLVTERLLGSRPQMPLRIIAKRLAEEGAKHDLHVIGRQRSIAQCEAKVGSTR
jgi:hypothetical protein